MKKRLMVLGPVAIERKILGMARTQPPYMRTADFSKRQNSIFENLKYVFRTRNPVIHFPSSGTGAMCAAVDNFFSEGEKICYVDGGDFGARWGDICRQKNLDGVALKTSFGHPIDPSKIETFLRRNPETKGVFLTLNETSSGTLTDVRNIASIVHKHDALCVVDVVSALAADSFAMDAWKIDVAVAASQKGLAIPPGLGFLCFSEKALDKAKRVPFRSFYTDIFSYLENLSRGQTPFTPAISVLLQLEERLRKMRDEGLSSYILRHKRLTTSVRNILEGLSLRIISTAPVNCVTAVCTKNIDASKIVDVMRRKFEIEIAPSGGEMRTKMFRVGTFGDLNAADVAYFGDSLEKSLKIIQ